MEVVVILLILVLAAFLINQLVPGGVSGIPGLVIFIIVALLLVGGGLYAGPALSSHPLFSGHR